MCIRDRDGDKARELMEGFAKDQSFTAADASIVGAMSSTRMDDGEIESVIADIYKRFNYVTDPHTACAFKELDELENAVVLSTADPAKFPDVIEKAIGVESTHASLEELKKREIKKYALTPTADAIRAFISENL